MKNYKNYLIALLAGLLVLSLSTQNSNGANVKTYDAVKLTQYDRCLAFFAPAQADGFAFSDSIGWCKIFLP